MPNQRGASKDRPVETDNSSRRLIYRASDDDWLHPEPSELQQFTDGLVRKTLLWLFPYWVRPNHLTVLRFFLVPVILLLLHLGLRGWAFAVFIAAVCTDFIDGAMARTRNQITKLGTLIDPLADKLLVGSVLTWLGYNYLVVQIILAFIFLEILFTAIGLTVAKPGRKIKPANVFGKTKMVIQSVAGILFLISSMFGLESLLQASLDLLWVAVILAFISGLRQIRAYLIDLKPPAAT